MKEAEEVEGGSRGERWEGHLPPVRVNVTIVRLWSVLCWYFARSSGGLLAYAVGDRLMLASSTSATDIMPLAGARAACALMIDCTTADTYASIVVGTHPDPENMKMVSCKNPEGPECVCVPEMATLASV
jgi:hypothetical protein